IDDKYLEYLTPPVDGSYRYKPLMDTDIFGDVDKSKLRLNKPVASTPPSHHKPSEEKLRKLRKLKPDLGEPSSLSNLFDSDMNVGTIVSHTRFGRGEVLKIEGAGNDKKAERSEEHTSELQSRE